MSHDNQDIDQFKGDKGMATELGNRRLCVKTEMDVWHNVPISVILDVGPLQENS